MSKRVSRLSRRLGASATVSVACVVLFAASAMAGSGVWLNWVNTTAHYYQSTSYKNLYQVEGEAKSYDYGCANAWSGSHWFWSGWFCAQAGRGATTTSAGGYYLAPYVWNDSSQNQQMWGWQSYQ
jgi:hypothetical protein